MGLSRVFSNTAVQKHRFFGAYPGKTKANGGSTSLCPGPTVVSPPPLTCSDLAASARPLASSAPPPVPEEVRLQTNTEATQRAVTLVVVTPSPVSAQSPHSLQVRSRFLSGHLPSDA